MNKLLITIATLFAYSIIFAQTWNTGTGAWISPLSKNIGIQKSLQVGDNVGTDSLWCKTDLNYFEGNVGIGTTTPEAKLHVSISDTTGIEIAHFENNIDNAIITVHTHSDSLAFYGLQTEDFNSALGLSGTTGEVILLTGLGSVAIEIDTNNNVTMPDLAGSAQKLVTALADGRLDTASVSDISPFYSNGSGIFQYQIEENFIIGRSSEAGLYKFYLAGDDQDNLIYIGTDDIDSMAGNFSFIDLGLSQSRIVFADTNAVSSVIDMTNAGLLIRSSIGTNTTSTAITVTGDGNFQINGNWSVTDTTAPAAQIATLTNFPVAGDPTGFVNVEIPPGSGVIRKIPYW